LNEYNYPPQSMSTSSTVVSGTVYFMTFVAQTSFTCANLYAYLATAATASDSSDSFLGLYSVSGGTATLLSSSADQSTNWSTSGNAGKVTKVALTTPQSIVAGQTYMIGLVTTSSGTPPAFERNSNSGVGPSNVNLSASSPYLFSTYTTGSQTALPGSVTLSSQITQANALTLWAGAST
jgi:hypothetical protein